MFEFNEVVTYTTRTVPLPVFWGLFAGISILFLVLISFILKSGPKWWLPRTLLGAMIVCLLILVGAAFIDINKFGQVLSEQSRDSNGHSIDFIGDSPDGTKKVNLRVVVTGRDGDKKECDSTVTPLGKDGHEVAARVYVTC